MPRSSLPLAVSMLLGIALLGCPSEPTPKAPPSMETAPAAPPPAPAASGALTLPKTAGVTCGYVLKDISTETLGDQLAAGHEVEVRYTLRTRLTETGTLAYAMSVQHVQMKGKREAYSVRLDLRDAAQMRRMRGGADTLLMFDAVLYFALLDQELIFTVDDGGRLTGVTGGEAVRAAYLALHPPKPRADPHQQARVAVALSDESLARRFLPFAAVAPAGGLEPGDQPASKGAVDWAEYPADSLRAARLRWVKNDLVLEEKRAFAPSERPATLPAREGFPKVGLISGEDQTTVAMTPGTPCFARSATSHSFRHTWRGLLGENEVSTEQRREGTWLVQPAAGAPPLAPLPAAPNLIEKKEAAHPPVAPPSKAKGPASKPAGPASKPAR